MQGTLNIPSPKHGIAFEHLVYKGLLYSFYSLARPIAEPEVHKFIPR